MTRVDAVSLGIVVNKHAQRFYDEGEDFWPKRYAIWGRLVAGQPDQIGYRDHRRQVDGQVHAAGVPADGGAVDRASIAQALRARCRGARGDGRASSTPRCGPARSTTRSSTTARTEGLDAAQDALGARRSTRRRYYA